MRFVYIAGSAGGARPAGARAAAADAAHGREPRRRAARRRHLHRRHADGQGAYCVLHQDLSLVTCHLPPQE